MKLARRKLTRLTNFVFNFGMKLMSLQQVDFKMYEINVILRHW